MDDKEIHIIDNIVRSKMRLLDSGKENFFSDGLSVITNYEPYRNHVVIGRVAQSPENRIIYVKQGMAEIRFNLKTVNMTTRKLVIIPKDTTITVNEMSDIYTPMAFAFSGDSYRGIVPYQMQEIDLSAKNAEVVEGYFHLVSAVLSMSEETQDSVVLLLRSLLTLIQSSHLGHKVEPTDRKAIQMNDFLTILNTHYSPNQRNVRFYAELMGLSENHLSTVVRSVSGKTVMDWVNIKTVMEVNLLLNDVSIPIADIAERMGFSSAAQFDHYYKRQTGDTPNGYRKNKL